MSSLNRTTIYVIFSGVFFYWLSFNLLDQPIAHFFHKHPQVGMSQLFYQGITLLGDPKLAIGFIALSFMVAVIKLFKQPQSKLANNLLLLGIAMIIAIFFETTLKYLLGRYRPQMLFQEGLYGFHFLSNQFLLNSSPSGHATRVFVFVTGCSLFWQRLKHFFLLSGSLVCLSRLVLEFHYLSDVIFGALLGTLVTLWTAKIYKSMTISNHTHTFLKSR